MKIPQGTPEIDPKEAKDTVVRLILECKSVIQDIWDCKESLIALNNLNKLYKEKLKELEKGITVIENVSNEVDDESTRIELEHFAYNQSTQLEHIKTLSRKANLSSKLEINNRQKDSLVGSREKRAELVRERRKKNSNNQMNQAASDVTDNLLSITKMMDDTVKQSMNALETIEMSSKTIKDTDKELKDQSGLIQTSNRLLTKLSRRECTDKIVIFLALLLFFGTVLYILYRRILRATPA